MVDVSTYRVLVVDDEPSMCETATTQIREIGGPNDIEVTVAYTSKRAMEEVRHSYYDLVLLDLVRQKELIGYEVFRRLSELGSSADVLLMTRFNLDSSMKTLLKALAAENGPRLVGFFDKREEQQTNVRQEVKRCYERHIARSIAIENLGIVSEFLRDKRPRYERRRLFPLRDNAVALDVEVERLLRLLYVEVPRGGQRSLDVSVRLDAVDRRGLSAAVVLNANVRVALKGGEQYPEGHRTVLKIGPKNDIFEEASRFREFVRYGVELDQRVELLAVAGRDSLGGLVYSFAGGVFRKELASLDELLLDDISGGRAGVSKDVLEQLFRSRHWYGVSAGDMSVVEYFDTNYRTNLLTSFENSEEALMDLPGLLGSAVVVQRVGLQGRGDPHYVLKVGNAPELIIPDSSVLGLGSLSRKSPACLVHGDMHAGNVMLEVSTPRPSSRERKDNRHVERVSLIDFRNSGPGPRCIDAVALESSVRLADSEAIKATSSRLEGDVSSERIDAAAAEVAAARHERELQLYITAFMGKSAEEVEYHASMQTWQIAALEILTGIRRCFPDITLGEYLGTSLRYTVRQLGFDMSPVARIRILAWLAAQYELQGRLSA